MRNPAPSRALAALLVALSAVFAYRTAPLVANVDDHVRLYFGGYVGSVQLRGGARAAALRRELQAATERFEDEYLASRFVTAQTPYSPLTLASVAVADAIRPLLRPARALPWILAEQTLLWAAMLALALRARAALPACPLPWFLAVGLALAWIHAHTSPLYPVPRAFACLFTGIALALAATGAPARWAAGCLVIAAAAHPYNQTMNLAIALPVAVLLAGTPAAPSLRRGTAVRLAVVAVAALAVSMLIVYAASPRGLSVVRMWGEQQRLDVAGNWSVSRTLVQRLSVGVGLPLAALVYRYCGWPRAALVTALFLVTVIAAATLQPAGHYPTEYLSRLGGAWAAVLLGLCLRQDLLPDLTGLARPRRLIIMACTALVALPAAFPELTRVPNAIHRPLGGWPEGIRLSSVEAECIRILRESGNWPARRGRPQGETPSGATR